MSSRCASHSICLTKKNCKNALNSVISLTTVHFMKYKASGKRVQRPKILFKKTTPKISDFFFRNCAKIRTILCSSRIVAIHSRLSVPVMTALHWTDTTWKHDFNIFYCKKKKKNFSTVPQRNSHQCLNELQHTGKTCQLKIFSKSLPTVYRKI